MRRNSTRVSPRGNEQVNCSERRNFMDVHWVFIPIWSLQFRMRANRIVCEQIEWEEISSVDEEVFAKTGFEVV